MSETMETRAAQIEGEHLLVRRVRIDRMFIVLLLIEYVAGIVAAITVSPFAWEGKVHTVHLHVWVAVLGGAGTIILPILLATKVGDWPAVLIIGLAASAHQAWSANLFTTVSDMFAKKDVATIIGLGGMAGSIGGMLFPWFAGRLLDRYHGIGDVTAGYTILFAICASAYLIAFAINHLLAPTFEPYGERASRPQ